MEPEESLPAPRRRLLRRRWMQALIGVILVVLLLLVILWTQRRQIATDYIEGELERRDVQASYRIARIGFFNEVIEDVVIGDPRRPDLTATRVEIRLSWGFRSPKISRIKARGVRMYGHIIDKKLSFGEVDKLLPEPTGKPFEFPDLNVDLANAAVAILTPAGRIAMAIEGKGNLANGFAGEMAARSDALLLGKCAIERPFAHAAVGIDRRRPHIDGPIRADQMVCPKANVALVNPILDLKANVSETLNSWRGSADLRIGAARVGDNGAAGVAGRITFDGRKKLTRGAMNLSAVETRIAGTTAARTALRGRYALSLATGNISLLADASARGMNASATLRPLIGTLSGMDGTPVDPIGDALAGSLSRAGQAFDVQTSLRLVNAPRYGAVRLETLNLVSRSGARFGLNGGEGITYYWPTNTSRIDGQFGLTGGGFPAVRASLSQPRGGAPMRGEAVVAPFAAGNARIALTPIRFGPAGNGATRIETGAVLSGPFKDGYIERLALPIAGYFGPNGFAFGTSCINAGFESLRAAGLRLGRTRLPLCPTGRALIWQSGNGGLQGGADISGVRLAGRLGGTPILLTSDRVRVALGDPGFTSINVAIRLGQGDYINRLNVARLDGKFNKTGVAGTFAGGAGKLANVPLLLSEAQGNWRVSGGDVTLNGGLRVADERDPPRFFPLQSNDFALLMRDNQISVTGWLNDPETGTRVTQARIEHSLNTGTGHADLDVPGITFALDGYQPDDLTPLTTGVIALVDGTVTGGGRINWNRQGTTSTGSFSTADMDLAAPFGPVEGLKTTINFTDLLGLTSAPGQLAEVGLIRTGIDVIDGQIRYQLLPDLRVRVESGRWPFAGGILSLDDTILDFSQPSNKKLTFHVEGLDAATFIEKMEFTNLAATGTFDGVLPMEFDQSGGRITGGRLEARPEGGTLSYIGVVTEAQLGAYGKMVFEALKSLRYNKFIINLNGSLEGEFLAGIELDGIARNTAPQPGIAGYVLKQLAKLRFEFNINIKGPFRALIGTARSFEDPSQLIQPVLPEDLQNLPTEVVVKDEDRDETKTVQPQESEIVQ